MGCRPQRRSQKSRGVICQSDNSEVERLDSKKI
jgi:hypothetical protein